MQSHPGADWSWFRDDGGRRAALLERRARMLRTIRRWFEAEDFLEVETPHVVRSPGVEPFIDALEVSGAWRGTPAFLHTSPEFHMKRLLAAGFGRVMQLCRCFRAGELGERHQPEFTMLEWYRRDAGPEAVMRDTEAIVCAAWEALRPASASLDLAGGGDQDEALNLEPPWPRITVAEAFFEHAGADALALSRTPERFHEVMALQVQPQLGHGRPVFVVDWPIALAALAQPKPGKPELAERFEAYVQGVELCNGFGELTDAVEQRRRFEEANRERTAANKPPYPLDERFLAALPHMPKAAGNALGVDRLLMLLTNTHTIQDVVAFDHSRV